jgi:hypothetical protein
MDRSIDGDSMAGAERRVSATEARVCFGELLDGVTIVTTSSSWNGDLLDVARW